MKYLVIAMWAITLFAASFIVPLTIALLTDCG